MTKATHFALGACLRPAIFVTAQNNSANSSNYCNYMYSNYCTMCFCRGSSCKWTAKWQNDTKCVLSRSIVFVCVCEYFVISCLCVCAMLCTSPLCWCKFGSSLAHSGATTCHGSGPFVKLSSYTSSLAMAVWTPLIAPDLNHSSVSHSLIHW